ncbi:MAG: glucose-1-phosphate cytidylyltransferase [Oscillospiraceae bacterium]|nr:glucose-1-phosphate cytidylyltransferase [Oscillospiraceae bacterium]
MKVVILAGGLGTRISEESHLKPKPMIGIGEHPIIWHIMKYYSEFGFNDFVICCGYKSYVIKEYFSAYYMYNSDVTFDFTSENSMTIHNTVVEPWKVTLAETGMWTQTGGRIKKIQKYIGNETFMMTYGDGVSNVDLNALLKSHRESGAVATMTAIQPGGRFGVLEIEESGMISKFSEKAKEDGGWINGGFMVLEPEIFDYLNDDELLVFERKPLEALAKDGKLNAYKHHGYWQCMDTMRDKGFLEEMWESGKAPWKIWK